MVDIVIMSPIYIKDEFLGLLLKSMNTHKVFSFIPLNLFSDSIYNTLSTFDVSAYDLNNNEKYEDYLKSICFYTEYLTKSNANNKPLPVGNPTIVILCDKYYRKDSPFTYTQPCQEDYLNEYGWVETRADYEVNIFPFGNLCNDLSAAILEMSVQSGISDQIRLYRTSVYFHSKPEFTETFDFNREKWVVKVARHRQTGKVASYIHLLIQKTARDNQDILTYINEEGKRKIHHIVTDKAFPDYDNYMSYKNFEAEQRRLSRIDDDDSGYGGCGEGWSCDNCPNYGCPANQNN